MVLDPSFLSMMPETIEVFPTVSTDSYGKVTFSGSSVGTRAYVQETGRVIKTADNRDVYEEGKVIFSSTLGLEIRLWWKGTQGWVQHFANRKIIL